MISKIRPPINRLLSQKAARVIFWLNAIIMLGVGSAFVTANAFFPFHGDVVGLEWERIEPRAQTLYLGMMRTEGAGYLAAGTAMLFLLLFPLRRGMPDWAIWAITCVSLVEHTPTLIATFHVAHTTPASPPWELTLFLMLSLIVAAALSFHASYRLRV